jgi:hypothetical protein
MSSAAFGQRVASVRRFNRLTLRWSNAFFAAYGLLTLSAA